MGDMTQEEAEFLDSLKDNQPFDYECEESEDSYEDDSPEQANPAVFKRRSN